MSKLIFFIFALKTFCCDCASKYSYAKFIDKMTYEQDNGMDGKLFLFFILVIALPIFVPIIGRYMYKNWTSVKKYGFFPPPGCTSLELWKKFDIKGVIYKREELNRKNGFEYFIRSDDYSFYFHDNDKNKYGTKYTEIVEVGDTVINGIDDDTLIIKHKNKAVANDTINLREFYGCYEENEGWLSNISISFSLWSFVISILLYIVRDAFKKFWYLPK